jgi:hypothetical protein
MVRHLLNTEPGKPMGRLRTYVFVIVVFTVVNALERKVTVLVFATNVVVLVAVPERTVTVRGSGGLENKC